MRSYAPGRAAKAYAGSISLVPGEYFGIRMLTSVSREGRSTVTVEFDLHVDLERVANDVRDRVSRAVGLFPPDADRVEFDASLSTPNRGSCSPTDRTM